MRLDEHDDKKLEAQLKGSNIFQIIIQEGNDDSKQLESSATRHITPRESVVPLKSAVEGEGEKIRVNLKERLMK